MMAVQAAERLENARGVLLFEADSVVAYTKDPFAATGRNRNVDPRRLIRAPVFDRVPDQILKHLRELRRISPHHRQAFAADLGSALTDCATQVLKCPMEGCIGWDLRNRRACGDSGLCVSE